MKDGRLICGVGPLVRWDISLPALTSSETFPAWPKSPLAAGGGLPELPSHVGLAWTRRGCVARRIARGIAKGCEHIGDPG